MGETEEYKPQGSEDFHNDLTKNEFYLIKEIKKYSKKISGINLNLLKEYIIQTWKGQNTARRRLSPDLRKADKIVPKIKRLEIIMQLTENEFSIKNISKITDE